MSTSVKSKKPSRTIDRPFAPAILRRAREIAAKYQIVIHTENRQCFGRGLELPLVMADGKTADACLAATRDALTATVAYLLEAGKRPPAPASEQIRSVQINIRLTTTEKETLEQAAQRHGFRGLSDYVRHAALQEK